MRETPVATEGKNVATVKDNSEEIYIRKWLEQIKELLKSKVEETRIEKFLEMLQNEIPVILSSLLAVESRRENETEVKMANQQKENVPSEEKMQGTQELESKLNQLADQNLYLRK